MVKRKGKEQWSSDHSSF